MVGEEGGGVWPERHMPPLPPKQVHSASTHHQDTALPGRALRPGQGHLPESAGRRPVTSATGLHSTGFSSHESATRRAARHDRTRPRRSLLTKQDVPRFHNVRLRVRPVFAVAPVAFAPLPSSPLSASPGKCTWLREPQPAPPSLPRPCRQPGERPRARRWCRKLRAPTRGLWGPSRWDVCPPPHPPGAPTPSPHGTPAAPWGARPSRI